MKNIKVTGEPCSEERIALRAAGLSASASASASVPVVLVHGFSAPVQRGRGGHWTTLSGKTEVKYPSAYGRPVLYHRSTIRIEVGVAWLEAWRRAGGVYLPLETTVRMAREE